MTWTATERHHRGKLFIDVVDENDQLACRLFEWATDGAAIEQMRARARLIVQAEAMLEELQECREYFDGRADADQPSGLQPQPNEEMTRLTEIDAIIAAAQPERGES